MNRCSIKTWLNGRSPVFSLFFLAHTPLVCAVVVRISDKYFETKMGGILRQAASEIISALM